MNAEIKSQFSAEIEGVEINDQLLYRSAVYLLENMEEKFVLTPEFTRDFLTYYNEYMWDKTDDFTLGEIENGILEEVDSAEKLEDLKLPEFYPAFQEKLEAGTYGKGAIDWDNKKTALELIKEGQGLFNASERLRDDEDIVRAAATLWENGLKRANHALEWASDRLRDDKEFVLSILTTSGQDYQVQHASARLRDDEDVVRASALQSSINLKYASDRLRNDKKFVLDIVMANGSALKYVDDKLRNDKEVVMAAVQKNGWTLQFASEKLRDDKEVVMAAIRQDGWSVLLAGPNCQQDIDCIKLAEKTVDIKAFLPPERVPQIVVRHTTDKGIER